MTTIPCARNCQHQSDGYCALGNQHTVSSVVNDCMYYVNQYQITKKMSPSAVMSVGMGRSAPQRAERFPHGAYADELHPGAPRFRRDAAEAGVWQDAR